MKNTEARKILFFSDCFIFGGCEIVLTNLLKSNSLASKFELEFAYRSFKEYENGLSQHKLKNSKLTPLKLISYATLLYNSSFYSGYFYNKIYVCILRILQKTRFHNLYNTIRLFIFLYFNKADILVVNNGGYPGSDLSRLCILLSRFANFNKVFFIINNMAYDVAHKSELRSDVIINKIVDVFITASDAAKFELHKKRGFPLEKIVNISNTVELKKYDTNSSLMKDFNFDKNIVIGAVGLLTKRKGFDILIRALQLVNNSPNYGLVKLVIFGDGEDKQYLQDLIYDLKLENDIILAGHRTNVLEYMNQFDALVVPSVSNEDMPYVIIEAMMLKKPIIGTRIAGIPEEIIDGYNGFLVEPNDIEMLSNKILELCTNVKLRIDMGENSYKRYLKYFEYDIIIKRYIELFN